MCTCAILHVQYKCTVHVINDIVRCMFMYSVHCTLQYSGYISMHEKLFNVRVLNIRRLKFPNVHAIICAQMYMYPWQHIQSCTCTSVLNRSSTFMRSCVNRMRSLLQSLTSSWITLNWNESNEQTHSTGEIPFASYSSRKIPSPHPSRGKSPTSSLHTCLVSLSAIIIAKWVPSFSQACPLSCIFWTVLSCRSWATFIARW